MLHGILGMVMLAVEKVVVGKGGGFYPLLSYTPTKRKKKIQGIFRPFFFFLVALCGSFESGSYIPGKKNLGGKVTAVSQ